MKDYPLIKRRLPEGRSEFMETLRSYWRITYLAVCPASKVYRVVMRGMGLIPTICMSFGVVNNSSEGDDHAEREGGGGGEAI